MAEGSDIFGSEGVKKGGVNGLDEVGGRCGEKKKRKTRRNLCLLKFPHKM